MKPLKNISFQYYMSPSVDCTILYILEKGGFREKILFPHVTTNFSRQEYFRLLDLSRTIGQIMEFVEEDEKKAQN
jgi:hypothetical protein